MTSFMLLSLLIFIPLVGSAIVGFGFAKSYDRSVAKVLLLRPGEVCKIQRYDKISFENLYYRVCV